MTNQHSNEERLRRWRLNLGGGQADGICTPSGDISLTLSSTDQAMDNALSALYDSDRSGGLGSSSPKVARWLGDIRTYFPTSVVKVMQQDALKRLNLRQMLLEPEMLEAVEPDVHLVANLLALSGVMPSKTKETARIVVRRVVEELQHKLANPMCQAVMRSITAARRQTMPSPG